MTKRRTPREVIAWIDRTPNESLPTKDDYDFADEVLAALSEAGYRVVLATDVARTNPTPDAQSIVAESP